MKNYSVTVTFYFEIEAEDGEAAESFAEGAFEHHIYNPQTKEYIQPSISSEEDKR